MAEPEDIARIFDIDPEVVGDDWKATYSASASATTFSMDDFERAARRMHEDRYEPDVFVVHPSEYRRYEWTLRRHDIFQKVDWDRWLFPLLTWGQRAIAQTRRARQRRRWMREHQ